MSLNIECELCNGNTHLINKQGALESYQCEECNHQFYALLYYIPDPDCIDLPDAFEAVIDAEYPQNILKLSLKVKLVFRGHSNFYLDDLNRQISQSSMSWHLGAYSEEEVKVLQEKASKINLPIRFTPVKR